MPSYSVSPTSGTGLVGRASAPFTVTVDPEFNPADHGAVALWLKADSLTGYEDEDVIDVWPDSSGSGNDATQATFMQMPLYVADGIGGRPALLTDGVDDSLFAALPVPRPYTAIVVYRASLGATGRSLSGGSENWLLGHYGGKSGHHYADGFVTDTSQRDNDLLAHIATAIGGVTSSKCYHDGADVTANNAPTGAWGTGLSIGANNGVVEFFSGYTSEVLVFSEALSDAGRQAVEQYLAGKYGIPLS